ncbi:MAG: hypothetical protein JWR26_977 [Pedosphaera sp.]|nr:hypothetical protein [Pedosphaera sp.]
MFGTIRRHQSWLLVIVATITIASFVVFGPSGCIRQSGPARGGDYGSFDNHRISQSEFASASRDVRLETFLQKRSWPSPEDPYVQFESLKLIAMHQKERELGIRVSDEAVAAAARQFLAASKISFDQFIDVLKPQGLDANDFDRFLRGQLAQRQLVEAASLTGRMVTPQEAESLYRLEHQQLATDLVFFSTSNFLSSVSVTPEIISSFYSNRVADYRIPEQVQVSYVKFNVTNYLAAAKAAATNLDQMADQAISRLGTNYLRYGKTPAEAKAVLKDDELHSLALVDARKEAGQFADELDKGTNRVSPAALEELAKKKGLTALTTAPFTLRDGPMDLKVADSFTHAAFALTPEDPFTGAILADDGVYVLAYKQRIPSRIPDIKTMETKVTADYRETQARQLAQQAAMKFDTTLTNGLAQGKTFKAIADEAKVKFEALPPFSFRTETLPGESEDKVELNQLKQYAFTTPVGMASQAVPARDGAFVLYVEKQLPLDETKMKAELPAFTNSLRDSRQNEAFNEWFNAQLRADQVFIQRLQKLAAEAQMAASRPRS